MSQPKKVLSNRLKKACEAAARLGDDASLTDVLKAAAVFCMVAFVASCSCCLWSLHESPRFLQCFDIGKGRQLEVWSIRDGRFFDVNQLLVYYRVKKGHSELVHQTFLEHDDGGDYRFNVVFADSGRLSCVYEVTRAQTATHYLLMFDEASGESWPRVRDDESCTDSKVFAATVSTASSRKSRAARAKGV